MSPQILSLIVFAENIHLDLNQPTEIVVCAPAFSQRLFVNLVVHRRVRIVFLPNKPIAMS
jgi:hypothetical protein